MPYTMDNMPESMKGAPKQAMEIFIAAFNPAFEKNHVEGAAMAIAMAAVHKAGYTKDENGKWIDSSPHPPSKGGEVSPAGGGLPSKVVIGGAGGGNHSEWDPVFKTGSHTDSEGNTKNWTLEELDIIVAKYNPAEHEPPVVIGHPEHNSPAWGWVEGLKREGELLYAKYKDLVPEFVDMIKRGFYKKKSISLYPDLTLRHIGFLGAMPPAVKGIPNTAFNADKESINIEFGDFGKENSKLQTLNSKPVRKEAKCMKWFDWMKKKAADEGVTIEDAPVNFSAPNPPPAPASGGQYSPPPAGDIKSLVDAEVAKVVSVKNAEFAETQKTLDVEKARLKAEGEKLEKAKADRQKDEIKSFCECLCKEGKLTPAMVKYGMGMTNFLEAISGVETTYEFSEGAEKKTQTPSEYIKGFLSCFKKQIEFGEFAGNEKDFKAGGNAGEKLSALTKKKMDEKKDISYNQAFSEVQGENPELAQEYAAEVR